MQRAACCRLPVSGRRRAQVLLDSERHGCQIYLAERCGKPLCLPQQVFLIARRQHSNFISAGFPVVVLVGFSAGRLLVCWQLYLLSCTCELQSRWASVCTGDHRVITILPPTVRMWHLKEDGRGIRWNDSSNAKQQRIPFVIVFQDWGYDQQGSWSGCSNHIWTRAERFTDWAHEYLSGPVDEAVLRGAIAARLQLRNHR